MKQIKAFSNYDSFFRLEEDVNEFLKHIQKTCNVIDMIFNSQMDTRAPCQVESAEWFSAVMIYEQLEGNTPESTNENIINMHKEFLKYEINEIQEQLEGQYIRSIDIDFLNGAKAGLEKSLKHLEQIGG